MNRANVIRRSGDPSTSSRMSATRRGSEAAVPGSGGPGLDASVDRVALTLTSS